MVFWAVFHPFLQGDFFVAAEASVHFNDPVTGLVVAVLVGWHAVYITHDRGPLGARSARLIAALLFCCCPLPLFLALLCSSALLLHKVGAAFYALADMFFDCANAYIKFSGDFYLGVAIDFFQYKHAPAFDR